MYGDKMIGSIASGHGSKCVWLLLFCLLNIAFPGSSLGSGEYIQRMRLPAGSYFIGGGGDSGSVGTFKLKKKGSRDSISVNYGGGILGSKHTSPGSASGRSSHLTKGDKNYDGFIPAHCIDQTSIEPEVTDVMKGWGTGLMVYRLKDNKLVDSRPFSDAIEREDPWISVTGDGSDEKLTIEVKQKGYDYVLDAPSGAIFADDIAVAKFTYEEIQKNENLASGLAMLDRVVGDIQSQISDTSVTRRFKVSIQKLVEWKLFSETRDSPASIGDIRINLDRELFGVFFNTKQQILKSKKIIDVLSENLSDTKITVNSMALLKVLDEKDQVFAKLARLEDEHPIFLDPALNEENYKKYHFGAFDLVSRGMPVETALRENTLALAPP